MFVQTGSPATYLIVEVDLDAVRYMVHDMLHK